MPPKAKSEKLPTNQSMVDHVVEEIISQVRRGRLVPGQRLIANDLAVMFNVSRAPVREALHILAGEGVVRLIPNRGAIIAKLTTKELVDFLEFTTAICALGVQRAIPKMRTRENKTKIRSAFKEVEQAAKNRNADAFIDTLYRYHKTVNIIADNTFLEMFYSRPYFAFYNRLLADFVPGNDWDEYLDHYRNLTRILTSSKALDSADEFERHMRWASQLLEANADL